MLLKTNQTTIYQNDIIKDAIRLIRQGECAFVYHILDINNIVKIIGRDNLKIITMNRTEAKHRFDWDDILYIVSYNDDILDTMALAVEKLYILKDMGFKISNPDKKYIRQSLSRVEVERRFWELYDKYNLY